MFYGIEDGSVEQEWHTYLLQRAEQERYARQVVVRSQPQRWFGAALAWLGRKLSGWGDHLQRRHDVIYEASDGRNDPAGWRPM